MNESRFDNSKVSIIGAARSGLAVAKLLQSKGAIVFVSEQNLNDKIATSIPLFKEIGVEYEFGKHTERIYDANLVVISPGVPSNAPVVREASKRGMNVVSELETASWFCPCPMVAITGSAGKTTTTTWTGRMFSDAGVPHGVGGNIEPAFSSIVHELSEKSVAILEVSSFQLDHIQTFHPKVSVILNITPNHLDRYENSFELYRRSKERIVMNQNEQDYCIYCYDDHATRELALQASMSKVQKVGFGLERNFDNGAYIENGKMFTSIHGKVTEIIDTVDISLKGVHNIYNAMAATLSAQIMGVRVASIRSTLKNFKGVEHRQEVVRELQGVTYINDSKATTVTSVNVALKAYDTPVILILGGREKGKNDYSELFPEVERHVKHIIALGESSDNIVSAFKSRISVSRAGSMEDAVTTAQSLSSRGEIVLLSPAGTAFDLFDDYKHRGREFKKCVSGLEER